MLLENEEDAVPEEQKHEQPSDSNNIDKPSDDDEAQSKDPDAYSDDTDDKKETANSEAEINAKQEQLNQVDSDVEHAETPEAEDDNIDKIGQKKLEEILASVAEDAMAELDAMNEDLDEETSVGNIVRTAQEIDEEENAFLVEEANVNFVETEELEAFEQFAAQTEQKTQPAFEIEQGYVIFHESFGYACQVCGTEVPISAKVCPGCGSQFALVKCERCGYTGEKEDFANHICPQCMSTPVKIPKAFPKQELCPSCKRPLRDAYSFCHLCGWLDWGVVLWLAMITVLLLIILPMFGKIAGGFVGNVFYYLGLLFGGLLLFDLGQVILRAKVKSKRFSFYWFLTVIMLVLIVGV